MMDEGTVRQYLGEIVRISLPNDMSYTLIIKRITEYDLSGVERRTKKWISISLSNIISIVPIKRPRPY